MLGGFGTGMICAHVVPRKGVWSDAVQRLVTDLEMLGVSECISKGKNESSMVAIKKFRNVTCKAHSSSLRSLPSMNRNQMGLLRTPLNRFRASSAQ